MKAGITVKLNRLPRIARNVRKELSAVVARTVEAVETGSKERVMDPPKTGTVYEKYNPRRTHQASAPGEAPATDLGDLVNSIHGQMTGELSGEVNVGAAHGAVLELGGESIEKRPYLAPTVEEQREPFMRDVAEAIRRGADA